jgi:hypothetical protein
MVSVSMWAVLIEGGVIADYSTFVKAERSSFDAAALVAEDYKRCQDEGARLRKGGFSGLIAPSAALPGTLNVTLFGARMMSTWDRPSFLASSIPAMIITKGAPPPGLLSRVHPRGSTANAITAYCSAAAASTSAWKTSW